MGKDNAVVYLPDTPENRYTRRQYLNCLRQGWSAQNKKIPKELLGDLAGIRFLSCEKDGMLMVYAQALYYYSTNDISKKREELDKIISKNALIYQVFDNETYGVETLDKQKYIGLVTTPTTSLKNFKMIETKVSPETKKIILIKFKIQPDEITK
jgi:hypothetical protein